MEVVHRHHILLCLEAKVIRGAVDGAAFDTSTRHPHREAVRIMIAALARPRQLNHWRTAKLTSPNHKSVLQHPTLLEVTEKRSDWLINLLRQGSVLPDVIVVVPRLTCTLPDLHHPDTALHKAARCQNRPCESAITVRIPDRLRLKVCIKCIRGLALHPVRQLIALQLSFETWFGCSRCQMLLVEVTQDV